MEKQFLGKLSFPACVYVLFLSVIHCKTVCLCWFVCYTSKPVFMSKDLLLCRLIVSLDESEKRYFSLLTQLQKNEKAYVELYKKLNRHANKGVESLLKVLNKQNEIANISRTKKQLYEQIIRSLRLKHEQVSVQHQLNIRIFEAFLLRKKGLSIQSYEQLESLKKEAYRYECYHQICTIIDHQLKLSLNNTKKGILEQVLSLHEEKQRALKQLMEIERFQSYKHQAFLLFRRDSSIRKSEVARRVEDLMEELVKTVNQATSFFSKAAHLEALALLYRLKMDTPEARRHYQKLLSLWELPEYKHICNAFYYDYKLHLYNYMNVLHLSGEHEAYDEQLAKASLVAPRFLEDEVEDFQNIEFLSFLKAINSGAFELAEALVPEIELKLDTYSRKMEQMIDARKITFQYNIAIFYFAMENFHAAESWFLRILTDTSSREQRIDLKFLSRVFLLVVYYEKGTPFDEEKLQTNTQRYLERNKSYLTFERMVLNSIKQLSHSDKAAENKRILNTLRTELKELKAEKKIRNGLEEIILWAQSKIEGQSMRALLLNKNA